jgi:hypothetical protein
MKKMRAGYNKKFLVVPLSLKFLVKELKCEFFFIYCVGGCACVCGCVSVGGCVWVWMGVCVCVCVGGCG